MTTAMAICFWVGTACVLAGFGCAIAQNFTTDTAKKVLNTIFISCFAVAFCCYIAYDVMK